MIKASKFLLKLAAYREYPITFTVEGVTLSATTLFCSDDLIHVGFNNRDRSKFDAPVWDCSYTSVDALMNCLEADNPVDFYLDLDGNTLGIKNSKIRVIECVEDGCCLAVTGDPDPKDSEVTLEWAKGKLALAYNP